MKFQFQNYLLFFFLLFYLVFVIFIFSLNSPTDCVEPNENNISDLLISQCDCSQQNNLRHFRLIRVQSCAQAPSSLESFLLSLRILCESLKLNVSKHGPASPILKMKNLSVFNPIMNIAVKIVLFIIKAPRNVLILENL